MGGKPVKCPHCESANCVKNGKANGKQTYLCKECFYRFTINATKRKYSFKIRKKAINLYKEGYTLTEISKTLNIKIQTIHHWVKKYRYLRNEKKT